MTWILIMMATAGTGVSIDHITFVSEKECQETAKNIIQANKEISFGKHINAYCVKVGE